MTHSFDTEIAEKVGVNAAILYQNIQFWCIKNEANNVNFYDQKYWTYNSIKAWKKLFPYLGDKAIRTALQKLEDNKYIKSGNYNKSVYDRTKWYAPLGKLHLPKGTNEFSQKGEPIPDNKPDNKEHIQEKIKKSTFNIGNFSDDEFQKIANYRKQIKKPLITQQAVTGILNKFNECYKLGYSFEQVFNIMAEKQWTTINPDWIKKEIHLSPANKQYSQHELEIMAIQQGVIR